MSIGKKGEPYLENNIQWQQVEYVNSDAGFLAALPGTPSSGLSNGYVFSGSHYEKDYYEINASLSQRYTPPATEREFIRQVEEAFKDEATVTPVSLKQGQVRYCADIHYTKESKKVRLFCSRNCLYWAIIEGDNLTLAPSFFNSVQITK